MSQTSIVLLSEDTIEKVVQLTQQLNTTKSRTYLLKKHQEMFTFNGYHCFGLFYNEQLIGVCSGWSTVKLYSGKQLELDNVIIDNNFQSKGYGKLFVQHIETWAKKNHYKTVELNTYVGNGRSHKFYFNQGFEIIGYHFQKKI